MKGHDEYDVFLFRAPDCIRGWLAYVSKDSSTPTVTVRVKAESGAKAKNKAITLANKGFKDLQIICIPRTSGIWDIDNFPELAYLKELDPHKNHAKKS